MPDRVDSHCHLWSLDRGDYGWLDPSDPVLAPIARDFDIADLNAADNSGGTCARIVVQAAPTVDETGFLLRQAAGHDDIAGVVGWVDLSDARAAKKLEHLARDTAFKGVRPMLQDIPDVDWINTQPRADAIAALIDHKLTFDALVLPQHLEGLLRFALGYPDLPIVIDHGAKPALSADRDDPRHAMWRDGMSRLAAETGARCKLSGLLTELAPSQRADAGAILRPVVDDLLSWFGPKRLMWGSDWPVVNLAGSYDTWYALSNDLLSGLADSDRMEIHWGTARGFYGLENVA